MTYLEAALCKTGYLGPFRPPNLRPEVEALVFGGKSGDVVGQVKTEYGWHILKIQEAARDKLDDFREHIEKIIQSEWGKAQLNSSDIRDEA